MARLRVSGIRKKGLKLGKESAMSRLFLAVPLASALMAGSPSLAQTKTPAAKPAPLAPAPAIVLTEPVEAPTLGLTPGLPSVEGIVLPDPVILPQPVPAMPAPAIAASPPPACRSRTVEECETEALQCLAAYGLQSVFDVDRAGTNVYLIRRQFDTTDAEEDAASDCGTSLNSCLAGGC